jgi:hypothetical protein
VEVYKTKDGSEVAVLAATWELNHKVTFGSLAKEFESNPTRAWRNYGSIVKTSLEAAIKDSDTILRAVNPMHRDPWDYSRDKFHEWFRGKGGIPYFLHYDLSVRRDACGKGLSHREANGQLVVDWMHQTVIPEGRNINFAHERQFAYDLHERGFHLELITYDQFQSEETRQILEEKGFKTDRASADKGTAAYDSLIEPLLETSNAVLSQGPSAHRRLDFYDHPVFMREMKFLKLINGVRYDHPSKNPDGSKGSKDVADGVACSVMTCLKWHSENKSSGPPVIIVHQPGRQTVWRQQYGDEHISRL